MTLLATERLFVRHWDPADAEAAFELYSDPEVVRYIGGQLEESVESTRARLATIRERIATFPAGMGSFPFVLRSSPTLIGVVLLKPLPGPDMEPTDDIEIGWHLARAHWGNGYATEAALGLLRYGFEALGLAEIHAVVREENTASHAVARRLGLLDVGLTNAYYGELGLRHYRLPRTDWERRAPRT